MNVSLLDWCCKHAKIQLHAFNQKERSFTFYFNHNIFLFSMSSTSQKHRNFVSEPMGEKLVTELAGIGPVLGERLTEKGFDKAYIVLGQFLLLKKDQEMFMEWIKDTCAANKKQGSDCHNCLKEWCDAFL